MMAAKQQRKRKPQQQHRPEHRAPHGSPIFSERIAAWVTPQQRACFDRCGGSMAVRRALDLLAEQEARAARAKR